jgi:hypothetical protein
MRWPRGVVQCQRQAQPQRPLAQRRSLLARQAHRPAAASAAAGRPRPRPALRRRLDALALLRHVALHQPARDQREQRQRGHHGEPDAQVQRAHLAVDQRHAAAPV